MNVIAKSNSNTEEYTFFPIFILDGDAFSPRNCTSFYLKMVCAYSLPGTVLLFFSKWLVPILSQELYFQKGNWRMGNMQ